jgi:hypothetical protein
MTVPNIRIGVSASGRGEELQMYLPVVILQRVLFGGETVSWIWLTKEVVKMPWHVGTEANNGRCMDEQI